METLKGSLNEKKILIVDDHPLFREGLNRILKDAGICTIKEAANGQEAQRLIDIYKPDIILMDLYMPGENGIEVTKKTLERNPSIRIIILTVCEEDTAIAEALRAGAHGFINKNMHGKDIINSLCHVLSGKIPMAKPMTKQILSMLTYPANLVAPEPLADRIPGALPILSRREREILSALAQGLSNKEIAQKLYISENTVKNHVRNVLEKLQAKSRTQAVAKAVSFGVLLSKY